MLAPMLCRNAYRRSDRAVRHRNIPSSKSFPLEDEGAYVGADEDTDDDVPIVVHGQEHNEVRHCELHHVEECPDCLFEDGRAETLGGKSTLQGDCRIGRRGSFWRTSLAIIDAGRGGWSGNVLADEVAVVLLNRAAHKLERHDQQDDADARSREHARRPDVPRRREEARVDCVPIPEHLVSCMVSKQTSYSFRQPK